MTTNAADMHEFSHDFPEGMHLCYIFSADDERVRTMSKLLAHSIASKQKVLHIIDTVNPPDLRQNLVSEGIADPESSAGIVTMDNDSAYCPGGTFDPIALLENAMAFCRQATANEGYRGARVCGDMSWVARRNLPLRDLMDYEKRVNHYVRIAPCTAVCEYDARKFDGRTIMDVLSVHPAMIVGAYIVRNPYFVPPGEVFASAG